jgi:glyoxylate/hydroxypyruvate reductase A
MTLQVVLCVREGAAREWLEALRDALAARGLNANLWWRDAAKAEVQANAELAEIAVVWRPPNAFFIEQTRLKSIFNLGAGVDALLALPNLPRNITLLRLEDAGMAPALAEYVLTAVLRVYRGFDRYAAQQAARRWKPEGLRDRSTYAIGVLGLGAIGSAIATNLVQHGFAVRGHAQSPKNIAGVECSAGEQSLDAFFVGLDVLVNVLPLTAASHGLIDRAVLGRLARGAHLINVGRGATLVDADLIAALDDGHLSGATLDVFATEPLPVEHPFWTRPKILITPHVSAETQIAPSVVQVADKLAQLARGERISGVVDLERGY